MTQRDMLWRAGGTLMVATGYIATTTGADAAGLGAMIAPAGFLLATAGLLLMLGGKRVPLALRIERSRHRELPAAIRARRHSRRAGR